MRVDFYLLQEIEVATDNKAPTGTDTAIDAVTNAATEVAHDTSLQAKLLFACRLIEKAYLRGHQLFVYCNTQEDAELLDELLWTFQEASFIPHNLQGEGPDNPPPVQIGYGPEPCNFSDILLNLAENIPAFTQRFQRIMEIVPHDEAAKEICRLHYREYRSQGATIKTHQLERLNPRN